MIWTVEGRNVRLWPGVYPRYTALNVVEAAKDGRRYQEAGR